MGSTWYPGQLEDFDKKEQLLKFNFLHPSQPASDKFVLPFFIRNVNTNMTKNIASALIFIRLKKILYRFVVLQDGASDARATRHPTFQRV